jgi:hypothetical protein
MKPTINTESIRDGKIFRTSISFAKPVKEWAINRLLTDLVPDNSIDWRDVQTLELQDIPIESMTTVKEVLTRARPGCEFYHYTYRI